MKAQYRYHCNARVVGKIDFEFLWSTKCVTSDIIKAVSFSFTDTPFTSCWADL